MKTRAAGARHRTRTHLSRESLRTAIQVATALTLCALMPSASQATDLGRPDAHAPIGVMGDHVHHAGEWMASYRYMRMRMDGNRNGTNSLSPSQVLASGFAVTPTDMDMQMHMFGLMAAPMDRLTLTAMIPYIELDMDHLTGAGTRFSTHAQGVGDLRLAGLVRLYDSDALGAHVGIGLSAPTGSIRHRDDTPAGNVRLPYPMQTGSGSWEFLPSLTVNAQLGDLSWGAQASGSVRLNENDLDYTLGDRADITSWLQLLWCPWLSTGLRVAWAKWGDIDGADASQNPAMVPTADPDLRAGERLDLGVSANLFVPRGALRGLRFGIEFQVPMMQSLDGPQLESDWNATVGTQYTF